MNTFDQELLKLRESLVKIKSSGLRVLIVNLCRNLISALDINTEQEFKRTVENLLGAGLKTFRESNQESPANLVKYFKQFRNSKTDFDTECEFAEKLITRAGSFQNAKDCISWLFTCDLEMFNDSAKRPWRMHEIYGYYSLYLKHNDPKEAVRKKLLEEHFKKEIK